MEGSGVKYRARVRGEIQGQGGGGEIQGQGGRRNTGQVSRKSRRQCCSGMVTLVRFDGVLVI